MKRQILSIVFLAAMIIFVSPAHALLVSNSDAWEYTNISSITAGTIHVWSNANNMFGADIAVTDHFHTVFNDTQSQGYWHTVEWTLDDAITLGSFNMVAAHDGGQSPWYHDQDNRGISAFKLEYEDASNVWQTLFLVENIGTTAVLGDGLTHPVHGGGANYPSGQFYELYTTVAPTYADTWRASFKQYGQVDWQSSGPRILELDGYVYQPPTNGVPEPATMLLLGLGLIGLAGARRKCK